MVVGFGILVPHSNVNIELDRSGALFSTQQNFVKNIRALQEKIIRTRLANALSLAHYPFSKLYFEIIASLSDNLSL